MGLYGNKKTQQEFGTEYVFMYAVYICKLSAYHARCEMMHDCWGVNHTKIIIYW